MATTTRTFEDRLAVRERTPLLIGLVGPSGTGKTFSALRLATGVQRVAGGDVFVIDTEARRALHYADAFRFRHVAFGAPFGPLDYLAAIEHCLRRGARTIVVDSMSHEHEGPGGVLEMHAAELARLGGKQAMTMLAWQKPKSERRRLINSVIQMDCNFVFCFRAKEKLRIVKGKDPEPRGWMPIAGEEFVYELTLKCLLPPGANGVPTLAPEHPDEQAMVKVPGQFRQLFAQPAQLSEAMGEALARWAAGTAAPAEVGAEDLIRSLEACSDGATLRTLEAQTRTGWKRYDAAARAQIKEAVAGCKARIEAAAQVPAVAAPERVPGEDDGDDDPPTGTAPGAGATRAAAEGAAAPTSARAGGARARVPTAEEWVGAVLATRSREAALQLWAKHGPAFGADVRRARADTLARWMAGRTFAASVADALGMLLVELVEAA